ncbi:looped-hinge helix DNA binding domain-containing protein, AbrB family [Halomicrobium zhouii]|uniref:Looped-hinge helix DNA binding domain-containing protein, AbrB family n=1 Tax=Halomicrobium zhouii TaxID=767519 RepID=A0A1I6M4N1_9EURY|nr:AbrB/MazE/SpoVT family DNA-binding domain-containing protein [Halomicrobium zhouii]SFS10640.1 looped-hinge helix DNA binding domain-containing protein, AbrB family [Halomicrobium zhouii]
MASSDGGDNGDTYGTAEINDRGRLTIPKALREELHLDAGTEFEVVREGGDIRLVRRLPELETLTRDEEWGDEAFRDAGDATFGGR